MSISDVSILFVDDEPGVCEVYETLLGPLVSRFKVCNSVHCAYERLKKYRYDVVITDLHMPDADGTELIRKIHETYPHIQIVVVTGYRDAESMEKCLDYKVYDFIDKDQSLSLVRYKIEQLIAHVALKKKQDQILQYVLTSMVGISNEQYMSMNDQKKLDTLNAVSGIVAIKMQKIDGPNKSKNDS